MARLPERKQCEIVLAKNPQEVLDAMGCSEMKIRNTYYDKEGYVYFIDLENKDYISNNHCTEKFRYHYNPAPWNWM